LPCVKAIVDSYDKVRIVDDGEGVLDKIFVLDLVCVENLLELLLSCIFFGEEMSTGRKLEKRFLGSQLALIRLLLYAF
jgi:hypothetical protein